MSKKYYTFYYRGWDADGTLVQAHITAQHASLARNELALQGILIKQLRKKILTRTPSISAAQLLTLTQQLAVLVNACLPIVFCLNTVAQPLKPSLRALFKQMVVAIENGKSLSQAFQAHPYLFPAYFIQLIEVGEACGQLSAVLNQLTVYQSKALEQTQAFKKALLYPVFVFSISVLITLGLLLFIVPQFQRLFADFATALPPMTQAVFALSDFLQRLNLLGLSGFLLLLGLLRTLHLTPLLHRVPWLGALISEHHQAQYLRALSVALAAGLPLTQALYLAQQVVTQSGFAKNLISIIADIKAGVSLPQAFTHTSQFSHLVIQLVTIGEQSSQLPTMLAHGADVLEKKISSRMQQINTLLQPTLITLLGIILGGLIIALYLPVFKLGALY